MRLGDYLDKLAWSQADLARHAHISTGTVRSVLLERTISRRNAQAICKALGEELQQKIEVTDINEIHMSEYKRPVKPQQKPNILGINRKSKARGKKR